MAVETPRTSRTLPLFLARMGPQAPSNVGCHHQGSPTVDLGAPLAVETPRTSRTLPLCLAVTEIAVTQGVQPPPLVVATPPVPLLDLAPFAVEMPRTSNSAAVPGHHLVIAANGPEQLVVTTMVVPLLDSRAVGRRNAADVEDLASMLDDYGVIRARCYYSFLTVEERTHGLCTIGAYRRSGIPQMVLISWCVREGSAASIRAAVPATFGVAPDVPPKPFV